jgi:predicted RNA polymerase sigma factor
VGSALYDRLIRIQPSPVVELNRAVAVAMCGHPEKGLALIDALLARGELTNYLGWWRSASAFGSCLDPVLEERQSGNY